MKGYMKVRRCVIEIDVKEIEENARNEGNKRR